MKCGCTIQLLFSHGCKCGAIEFERALHVWSNGIIYTVATNQDEAIKLSQEYLSSFPDYTEEWVVGDGWTYISDDTEISLFMDEDTDDEMLYPAKEWIEAYGLGYLGVVTQ